MCDALFDVSCNANHRVAIEKFYEDIISCISKTVADVIPCRKGPVNNYNVPRWNTFVQEKHEAARQDYLAWVCAGRPRNGFCFDRMKRSHVLFKLALRHCKNNIEELKADACAKSLLGQDSRKFWKNVFKMSNDKATCQVNSVDGATGPQEIADMWKIHFQRLYSSNVNYKFCTLLIEKNL